MLLYLIRSITQQCIPIFGRAFILLLFFIRITASVYHFKASHRLALYCVTIQTLLAQNVPRQNLLDPARCYPFQTGLRQKKCTAGATISGIDLNSLSDADLLVLKEAIYTHQVVVIKDQANLDPVGHWELVTRLDPTAPQVHGHGTLAEFQKVGGMLAVSASRPFANANFDGVFA